MPAGLSTFALVALGLLIGLLLAALLTSVAAITYTLIIQRRESRAMQARMLRVLDANTTATALLRTEFTTSLARMDADRMHDASVGIQRATKQLTETVTTLWKLVYRATASADADLDVDAGYAGYAGYADYGTQLPPSLNEEAIADASKLGGDSEVNPLDLLSPEERAARIHNFFSARRTKTESASFPSAAEALRAQVSAEGFHTPHSLPHTNLPDLSPDDDLLEDSLGVSD